MGRHRRYGCSHRMGVCGVQVGVPADAAPTRRAATGPTLCAEGYRTRLASIQSVVLEVLRFGSPTCLLRVRCSSSPAAVAFCYRKFKARPRTLFSSCKPNC